MYRLLNKYLKLLNLLSQLSHKYLPLLSQSKLIHLRLDHKLINPIFLLNKLDLYLLNPPSIIHLLSHSNHNNHNNLKDQPTKLNLLKNPTKPRLKTNNPNLNNPKKRRKTEDF